jgi:hypothetical protein
MGNQFLTNLPFIIGWSENFSSLGVFKDHRLGFYYNLVFFNFSCHQSSSILRFTRFSAKNKKLESEQNMKTRNESFEILAKCQELVRIINLNSQQILK